MQLFKLHCCCFGPAVWSDVKNRDVWLMPIVQETEIRILLVSTSDSDWQ